MDSQITLLLERAADGDRGALDQVFQSLYPELRRLAHARLYSQVRDEGLNTTALVHESFLRLAGTARLQLEDRRHFFGFAAKTMRNVIIDEIRSLRAERRGGDATHLPLGDDTELPIAAAQDDEALRVHEALQELEALDPGLAEVVEMRYFGGYTEQEIAGLLGVDERTVRRRWTKARAALFLALRQDTDPATPPTTPPA